MSSVIPPHERRGTRPRLVIFLNLMATVHVVWFYLARVECYIKLPVYESGLERTPFQYRLLLMGPLAWAHHSHVLNVLAAWLTSERGWFPNGVRPEGLLQAIIDLVSICVTGLVARRMYRLSSRTGLLTAYVYPLTLLMVFSTYAFQTMHEYRFIYDLPAMAFFSLGLYCIYTIKKPVWLACLFIAGTLNRETMLLLLVFFALAQCSRRETFEWRKLYSRESFRVIVPLGVFWLAWRLLVARLFRANPAGAGPRLGLNIGTLAIPFSWSQLLSTFAYLLPLVIVYRRSIHDTTLRAWLLALPVWFVFMLYYGVLIETRIFGELIAYIACIAALIAEEQFLAMATSNPALTSIGI